MRRSRLCAGQTAHGLPVLLCIALITILCATAAHNNRRSLRLVLFDTRGDAMEHRLLTHAQPLAWLDKGVWAKHLAHYQAFLEERRYAPGTRDHYVRCVAHLAHWMASAGLSASQIGERTISRFLAEHLPRCECRRPVPRGHQVNRGAFRLFLNALREGGQSSHARRRTISAGSYVASISS